MSNHQHDENLLHQCETLLQQASNNNDEQASLVLIEQCNHLILSHLLFKNRQQDKSVVVVDDDDENQQLQEEQAWFHQWQKTQETKFEILKQNQRWISLKHNIDQAMETLNQYWKNQLVNPSNKKVNDEILEFENKWYHEELNKKLEPLLVELRYNQGLSSDEGGGGVGTSGVAIAFRDATLGKVVVSKRESVVKSGEVVFEEEPIVSTANVQMMMTTATNAAADTNFCHHCLKRFTFDSALECVRSLCTGGDSSSILKNDNGGLDSRIEWKGLSVKNSIACEECNLVRYCSEKCRSVSWDQYHNLLCTRCTKTKRTEQDPHPYVILERMSMLQQRTNPLLISKMLAFVVQRVITRLQQPIDSDQHISLILEDCFDVFERFIANKELHERDSLAIQLIKESIMMNVSGLSEENKTAIEDYLFNVHVYRQLNGLILRNASTLHPITDVHLMLQQLVSQKDTVSLPLLKQICQSEKLPIVGAKSADALLPIVLQYSQKLQRLCVTGTGVFAFHNCMNHSCEPNVVTMCSRTDRSVRVVALKDIHKDDEICISYIDDAMDVRNRRKALYSKYLFFCKCPRCIRESASK